MDWQDEGIILSAKRHGENSAIVSLLTRGHGRHLGLMKGATSKDKRGLLQQGNEVTAEWRARLAEHLGNFKLELRGIHAARLLDDADRLAALSSACAVADSVLPEREPHEQMFDAFAALLAALDAGEPSWPAVYIRWELGLLTELGYGLDLTACAATGDLADLTHVSPRSGRAVSRSAAAPYKERLLALPAFLAGGRGGAPDPDQSADFRAGLALTGFFLDRYLFNPNKAKAPSARTRFVERMTLAATRYGAV